MNGIDPATRAAIDARFGERAVLPLGEVADLTGWSLRGLLEDCRHNRVTHVNRRGSRWMTRADVERLLTQHTVAADAPPSGGTESDELAQARAFNASRSRRLRRTA